jgi:hypothetical protein
MRERIEFDHDLGRTDVPRIESHTLGDLLGRGSIDHGNAEVGSGAHDGRDENKVHHQKDLAGDHDTGKCFQY